MCTATKVSKLKVLHACNNPKQCCFIIYVSLLLKYYYVRSGDSCLCLYTKVKRKIFFFFFSYSFVYQNYKIT